MLCRCQEICLLVNTCVHRLSRWLQSYELLRIGKSETYLVTDIRPPSLALVEITTAPSLILLLSDVTHYPVEGVTRCLSFLSKCEKIRKRTFQANFDQFDELRIRPLSPQACAQSQYVCRHPGAQGSFNARLWILIGSCVSQADKKFAIVTRHR